MYFLDFLSSFFRKKTSFVTSSLPFPWADSKDWERHVCVCVCVCVCVLGGEGGGCEILDKFGIPYLPLIITPLTLYFIFFNKSAVHFVTYECV